METASLRKKFRWLFAPTVSNHAAGALVLFAAYVAATLTTLVSYNMLEQVLLPTGLVLIAVIIYATIVFLLSFFVRRIDMGNIAWGGSFVIATISSFALNRYDVPIGWNVQTLLSGMVIVWALRLCWYLTSRMSVRSENKGIVLSKKKHHLSPLMSYGKIFFPQGVLATLASLAIIHVNFSQEQAITPLVILGFFAWLTGFFLEATADYQLMKFRTDSKNKDKLMTKGLWQYARHPNYFGEILMWCGVCMMALSTRFGWVALITPAIIAYLLLFVSGVPMTERSLNHKKEWSGYKKQTGAFFSLSSR